MPKSERFSVPCAEKPMRAAGSIGWTSELPLKVAWRVTLLARPQDASHPGEVVTRQLARVGGRVE
jgi:hypothetical protein